MRKSNGVFVDNLHQLPKIDGIGKMTLKGLHDPIHLEEAKERSGFCPKKTLRYPFFLDDGYPSRLKHCFDGPILLFQQGNINLEHQKIISAVGTKNVTNYGTSFCNQFIEELAPLNPMIVSGLA
ncbi:DNA-processing protein DprA [Flagellimonas halotolerans]|uniref:DNA-processing protein DprA n=1 Tax=Flagellimonas halotolerans TaxID=3112164 RepID=A0ABU6ILM7_9FLAO|nr:MULTISPECIES: DNA-processing protein DprA [unclassified Allomuricauda]MEC3964015.1 DNA-processing protein DprA [Muricauda sp. SYSU M86414]MEC4263885.1 DNA-processing protein DprA [Muricauda sp. SYSU M84420]